MNETNSQSYMIYKYQKIVGGLTREQVENEDLYHINFVLICDRLEANGRQQPDRYKSSC